MLRFRWLLPLVCLALLEAPAHAEPLLRDGDRVAFIGDSITEQMLYTRYVMDYFAMRYPERTIHFRNRGIAGAPATFTQKHFDDMMHFCRPTVAIICFGMNDGHYKPFEQSAYDKYVASMSQWIEALKSAHVKTLLLTPGCCDERQSPQRLGNYYNETLRRLSEGTKSLATKCELPMIDLHKRMLSVQAASQKDNPAFVMIPDGVHPGPPGHVIMEEAVLDLLGCNDAPPSIRLEATTKTAAITRGQINDLAVAPEQISFTARHDSLPSYVDPKSIEIFKYDTARKSDRTFVLQAAGLAAGKWRLLVAGKAVGDFDASQLSAGVDLAGMRGPWVDLATQVDARNAELSQKYYQAWRGFSPIHFPKEVEHERLALVTKLNELLEADESANPLLAPANRTWTWTLKLQK